MSSKLSSLRGKYSEQGDRLAAAEQDKLAATEQHQATRDELKVRGGRGGLVTVGGGCCIVSAAFRVMDYSNLLAPFSDGSQACINTFIISSNLQHCCCCAI